MGKRSTDTIVIGTGAGFSADRLEPACAMARSGEVDFLVFECVGERTLAHGHRDRMHDASAGYNKLIGPRFRAVLPLARATSTRIITNMGSANPAGAAHATAKTAAGCGLSGLHIAYVEGDDITSQVTRDWELPELGRTIGELGHTVVGANAYLGVEHLLPAVASGADVIITGRFADPSLFMAPIVDRFGWALDDWDRLAKGTVAGHLLECGMQVTGGYFADPPYKTVPDLARCGYPMAEISKHGDVVVTKLATDGGAVTRQTVKEQLLYEVHDPSRYLTPDVTANFSGARIDDMGANRVRVDGIRGAKRPDTLKVTIGFDGGLQGEAGVSYAGPGAASRASLARDILHERLTQILKLEGQLRIDLIGVASLHATAGADARRNRAGSEDVRVHVAFASHDRTAVETVLWEVESLLCCGPAGGGGYRGQIVPRVITHSAFVPRSMIDVKTRFIET